MKLFTRIICAIGVMALANAGAAAQTAPAGNEHPREQMLTAAGAGRSPLGEPVGQTVSGQRKGEFAAAVDLSPLRDLPVFHSGRVKILDTLARETVQSITGKKRYAEPAKLPPMPLTPSATSAALEERAGAGRSFDPLFTLFDLIIDPQYYVDKPLIHVDYVPLRRAILERAFPEQPGAPEAGGTAQAAASDQWMRLTRLAPALISQYGPDAAQARSTGEADLRAINRVEMALQLWEASASNLQLVGPASRDLPWQGIGELAEGHPARKAAADLGAAWRRADSAAVNVAVRDLAAALGQTGAASYPVFRRELELAYNRSNAFEWGFWAYFLAMLALVLSFGTGRRWLTVSGVAMLVLAVGLHAFGFISRCIIAERFAIQNQFESMTGLSLFAAVAGLGITVVRRQWIFGAAAAAVGFLVLITATQTGIPGMTIEREAAILNTSVLLKYHVTTVLVSYGLIALGFIVSLFYLGTHYLAQRTEPAGASLAGALAAGASGSGAEVAAAALNLDGEPAPLVGRERVLADLDKAHMIVLQLAFWTLGVGILLGAWWADHSWGRFWAFDPKETWALATWIIYLIVVHVRLAGLKNRALTTAWLSVVGFIVMLWTYFGVNLLLPGLHAYA